MRILIFIKNQLKKERLPKQPLIIANKWSQGKKTMVQIGRNG